MAFTMSYGVPPAPAAKPKAPAAKKPAAARAARATPRSKAAALFEPPTSIEPASAAATDDSTAS